MTVGVGDLLEMLAQIRATTTLIDPYTFTTRLAELRRGGLPSTSIPSGSRGADRPMPTLDRTDQWLDAQHRTYRQGLAKAQAAMREVLAAQNALLLVMGQDIHGGDVDDQAKAMRDARFKANEEILGATYDPERHFQCLCCDETFRKSRTQRPRGGKCRACYDWWTSAGRPAASVLPEWVRAKRARQAIEKDGTE